MLSASAPCGPASSTDAVAREETELLSLQRESFHLFLASSPQVAQGLLASMSRLVRRVTQLVHDATFLDARTRRGTAVLRGGQITLAQPERLSKEAE
jgi:CRP-like cAMP-binding protein